MLEYVTNIWDTKYDYVDNLVDHKVKMDLYNQLKELYPHLNERELLEIVFAQDFDTRIPGKWITTKFGSRVYIYDDPSQKPKKIEYYTPEDLNIYKYYGEELGILPIHELEVRLSINKDIDLETNSYKMGYLNRVLETFPLKLKGMIKEIRVHNSIVDDPDLHEEINKVPDAYKQVGWDRKYDDIEGVYIISKNIAYLSINASENTLRHELGHSIWYGISERERTDFRFIHNKLKPILLEEAKINKKLAKKETDPYEKEAILSEASSYEYEANDPEEMFAESFARYYKAKRPFFKSMKGSQKQPFTELSTYFRTRMKKYERD